MPIDAKDLRIGNFIQTKDGLAKVQTIVQTIANTRIGGVRLENGGQQVLEYEDCEPIELTLDWLERFGFFKEGGYLWNGYVGIGQVDGGFYFGAMRDGIVGLSYVHELQNLAYAINQTELIVDE